MLDPGHNFELLLDLKRLATIVLIGGFAVALFGELLFPTTEYRWGLRRIAHGSHNLLLWVAGIAVMSVVFGGTIWVVLQWLQFKQVGILYLFALPVWLHAVLAFVLIDATDYLFHRLSHNVRWLWLLHAVHHSDPHVDVTTNLRQHPAHLICTQLWQLVAAAAIGVPAWVFLLHVVVNLAFAHLHHAAIRWPRWIDPVVTWLFITPRLHWNHHSPVPERTDSNFGTIFSAWDRCFGTYTAPSTQPLEFGLRSLDSSRWHSAWGMLLTPWRARRMREL